MERQFQEYGESKAAERGESQRDNNRNEETGKSGKYVSVVLREWRKSEGRVDGWKRIM